MTVKEAVEGAISHCENVNIHQRIGFENDERTLLGFIQNRKLITMISIDDWEQGVRVPKDIEDCEVEDWIGVMPITGSLIITVKL